MSGENLTPITRKEMFLAKAAGQNIETPEPITREEMFLSKISGGGSGGGSGGEEWIGDGNTYIWITLQEGRTSPMFGVCPKGTVTVDWGDGTTPDVLTGTSVTSVQWTPTHEYATAGDYVIKLIVDGEMGFYGSSSTNQHSAILRYSSGADRRNSVYQNSVQKVEAGNGVTSIGSYAFSSCYSLASVTIPDSVTSIEESAFSDCYSLASVTIPDSVTSIEDSAFYSCRSLASVTIPDRVTSIEESAFSSCYSLASVTITDSVTSIGSYAFIRCEGMRYYDFTNHTSVPTLASTNVFGNIPADCEIRVPSALYDEWIAATNWSTYANQIVAV